MKPDTLLCHPPKGRVEQKVAGRNVPVHDTAAVQKFNTARNISSNPQELRPAFFISSRWREKLKEEATKGWS
jgi:hypothetical protein